MGIVNGIGIATGWQQLKTAAPKCLYYGMGFSSTTNNFQGVNIDIDNTIFPSGWCFDFGTSIQMNYQADAGGFNPICLASQIYLWSLENDPITTTWSIMNTDDFSFNIVDMVLLDCSLTQTDWEVTIPVSGGAVVDFELEGASPFSGLLYGNTGLTTADPNFPIFLQSIFGGQSVITVDDDNFSGSCYIKIEKAYDAIRPKSITIFGLGVYTFTPL
jgi:hypothetical protein